MAFSLEFPHPPEGVLLPGHNLYPGFLRVPEPGFSNSQPRNRPETRKPGPGRPLPPPHPLPLSRGGDLSESNLSESRLSESRLLNGISTR